ncbi:hypothetical protein OY671_012403, partial [Metschnikowia pulcherrima]
RAVKCSSDGRAIGGISEHAFPADNRQAEHASRWIEPSVDGRDSGKLDKRPIGESTAGDKLRLAPLEANDGACRAFANQMDTGGGRGFDHVVVRAARGVERGTQQDTATASRGRPKRPTSAGWPNAKNRKFGSCEQFQKVRTRP